MNENNTAALHPSTASPARARLLFGAACVAGAGLLSGCSTLSSWGSKTVDAVSGAGAAVRDTVASAPPAISAPAGRRANDTAPPRQSAPIAPASAVGLGGSSAAPAPAPAPAAAAAVRSAPAPAPAPVAAAAPAPAAAPLPPPVVMPPPVSAAPATAAAPAPRAAAPAPSPAPARAAAAVPAPTPAPAARPAAPPPPAARATAPVTMAAVAPRPEPRAVAPGRYTVQVGAFAVAANAETTRDRINTRLAAAGDTLQPGERVAQVARVGERSVVMVGDYADRGAAEDLASRLRRVLNQDVAVIRR
jgi:hypothetical protein